MLLFLMIFFKSSVFAFIPPSKMILQRMVENSGSGTYVIEQEVQFNTSLEPILLRETWVIENENKMKLTVTGPKDQKDLVQMQYIYNGDQRWQLKNKAREGQRVSDEQIERIQHMRSLENLAKDLAYNSILPSTKLERKIEIKKIKKVMNINMKPKILLDCLEPMVSLPMHLEFPPLFRKTKQTQDFGLNKISFCSKSFASKIK